MKNMINKTLALPVVLAATIAATPAVNAAPWLKVDGNVNFDVTGSKADDYQSSLRVQDAEVRFELILREGIKAVVKAELEKQLNGSKMFQDYDTDKMIEEAYIQVETDKISGLPRAIITFGKHKVAFGQNVTELPMFKDRLLHSLAKQDEVIGMTVELPANFLKMVDSVAVSIFEAGYGDLKIADERGMSVKLSKKLSDQLSAQISYMMKEQAGKQDEQRGSVGFVFTSGDGTMKIWAEGLIIRNSPLFTADQDTYGATVGGSIKVGPGAVVVEYSYLRDQAQELAVAYNMPIGTNLVLSPEVRLRRDLTGANLPDQTIVGIRARLKFHAETEHNLLTGSKK